MLINAVGYLPHLLKQEIIVADCIFTKYYLKETKDYYF